MQIILHVRYIHIWTLLALSIYELYIYKTVCSIEGLSKHGKIEN